jgi:hypothetical protein
MKFKLTTGSVRGQFDFALIENITEGRPAASTVEFSFTREENVVANHTSIGSWIAVFVVNSGKWSRNEKTNKLWLPKSRKTDSCISIDQSINQSINHPSE